MEQELAIKHLRPERQDADAAVKEFESDCQAVPGHIWDKEREDFEKVAIRKSMFLDAFEFDLFLNGRFPLRKHQIKSHIDMFLERHTKRGLSLLPAKSNIELAGGRFVPVGARRPGPKSRNAELNKFIGDLGRIPQLEKCRVLDERKVKTPAGATWADLKWVAAYLEPQYKNRIKKFLSDVAKLTR